MDEIDKSILMITILTMIFSSVLIKLIKPTTIVALGVLTSVFVVGSAIFLLNVVYNESS